MHKSTASSSAAMRSINNDCVASQSTTTSQTTAQAYTLYCVRAGCPVGVVQGVGTDWRTVCCPIDDHARVCEGEPHGLANPPPPLSDTHRAKRAPRRPRHIPAKRDK